MTTAPRSCETSKRPSTNVVEARFCQNALNLRRGVTLLEVLLSMGLLVMLSSMTYWFYGSVLSTREKDTDVVQNLQLMRVTIQRLATEIRQASRITAGNRLGIRGEAERIWISSTRAPSKTVAKLPPGEDDFGPREYDLVKIEYKIARHPDLLHDEGYPMALGLARVEHLIPRPDSAESGSGSLQQLVPEGLPPEVEEGLEEEIPMEEDPLLEEEAAPGVGIASEIQWEQLYSKEIRFLRFCYHDGSKWWDDWDISGENPLPQLVQVTLGLEDHPPLDSEFGARDLDAEEFCTCLNREPPDCPPLPRDQFTMTVRVPQADPLFRSRVGREVKSLFDDLGGQGKEQVDEGTAQSSSGGSSSTVGSSGRTRS